VIIPGLVQCLDFSSVLWHCWLGNRKDIWPLKILCCLSQTFCFGRSGGRKPKGESTNPGFPEKGRSRRWWSWSSSRSRSWSWSRSWWLQWRWRQCSTKLQTWCVTIQFPGCSHDLFMAALHSRCGHYIFALWFLLSFFLFFPRLISAVTDRMSAILPHMVWP